MRRENIAKATKRFLDALVEGENINFVWEELKTDLELNDSDLQRALEAAEDEELTL